MFQLLQWVRFQKNALNFQILLFFQTTDLLPHNFSLSFHPWAHLRGLDFSLPCNNPVCRIWQNSTRSCACRFNHMHHVQYDLLYQNSGRSRGGAQHPPLIFRPNWGSKTGLSPTHHLPHPLPPVISRSGSSTAEYECMPMERLSIRKMRVLGAFPVVLDDLISNFLRGACPWTSPASMLMFHRSVPPKEGLRTRLQTIASPLICV